MSRFGIAGPTYQSQSPNADAELCENWYAEIMESGAANAPIALYPTPGSAQLADLSRTVSPQIDGISDFDKAASATGIGTVVSSGSATPATTPAFAIGIVANTSAAAFTVSAGWTFVSPFFTRVLAGPIAFTGTLNVGANWSAAMVIYKQIGAGAPAILQNNGISGAWNTAQNIAFGANVTKGNKILALISIGSKGVTSGIVVTDTQGNVYVHRVSQVGPITEAHVWETTASATGPLTVRLSAPAGLVSSSFARAVEIKSGALAVIQTGPIRGSITVVGRSFFVSGMDFAEVLANGAKTYFGTVANDGKPVTMAASPRQLLLASAGTAYVFDLNANALTAIPGATFAGPVSQAAICDDFFILTIKDSKQFYVSAALDANDWTSNGSAIVSVFPDNIVSMFVFQRQVWFFSDTQSVVYYDSGAIFPFDVNPNAFIEAGCAAINSVAILNNTIFWLGADARGHGKIWSAQGYTPARVSNHALEFAIQSYDRIDDAVAFSYQDQGHEFYVLYFPTPSVTWVYDAATGMWHKRGFWIDALGENRALRYWNHTFNFGGHLVGAWNNGIVYEMKIPTLENGAWTFADDNGTAIHRIRRAPHISAEQKRLYLTELQVYVETGIGPRNPLLDGAGNPREPAMDMRMSRDGGHTWSMPRTRGCGASGQFASRVRWLRLGQARDFVFEIHVSDPIGWRIVDAYIDGPLRGEN